MTAVLTPAQAAAYVRELSADVRAVAVLDAAGGARFGPPAFAAAAAALLTAWPRPADGVPGHPSTGAASGAGVADELVAPGPGGVVFAARDAAHAVVATAGSTTLLGPTALDVRAALGALGGRLGDAGVAPAPRTPADPALRRAIAALLGHG